MGSVFKFGEEKAKTINLTSKMIDKMEVDCFLRYTSTFNLAKSPICGANNEIVSSIILVQFLFHILIIIPLHDMETIYLFALSSLFADKIRCLFM